jgi:hypothetical protein
MLKTGGDITTKDFNADKTKSENNNNIVGQHEDFIRINYISDRLIY